MHMIQAKVFSTIIEYIQDKTGHEVDVDSFVDEDEGVHVKVSFTIPRDYPGMKEDEKDGST